MSVNSSSPRMDIFSSCFLSHPMSYAFKAYSCTNILVLLPLISFTLHHGLHQWRKTRSSSPSASLSHTDVFTFHMVVMDLLSILGCLLSLCSVSKDLLQIVGSMLMFMTWYGETFFHVLTCVERYLAVVHPVTYRSLRKGRGTRIRNAAIAVAWLLSAGELVIILNDIVSAFFNFCYFLLSMLSVSFCSLTVLHVLTRPRPGERGGKAERVDRAKRRAAQTIVSIWAALLLRFCWCVLWMVMMMVVERSVSCVVLLCGRWLSLPSSVVLPLLLLQREKKLTCLCRNTQKT